jgi:hypothetical protein
VLKPLIVAVSKESNQKEIKSVLAVIEILVSSLGDMEKAEAEVKRRWDAGDFTFNDQQFELGKKLFIESDFFKEGKKDLTLKQDSMTMQGK